MLVQPKLRQLDFEEAMVAFEEGAALIDFRKVDDYLDVHVPGSICLQFESGPGMNSRARDCIPLNVPLVLLDLGGVEMVYAAAALRGKGFTVLGSTPDAVNAWVDAGGKPGSTEVITRNTPPEGSILDVADPGARVPDGAIRIPMERMWARASEFESEERVVIAAGAGVRAAMSIGMLEMAGVHFVLFWKTGRSAALRPRSVGRYV
jgi:rhodanese-related sulfurtransferase